MTFPIVDRNDPRNWVAPGVDGVLGGPEYYQGRGPVPESIIAPLVYRKAGSSVQPDAEDENGVQAVACVDGWTDDESVQVKAVRQRSKWDRDV
jgi:hypothetical protein